ncbi:MAG: protein kinase [Aureliella sp.]
MEDEDEALAPVEGSIGWAANAPGNETVPYMDGTNDRDESPADVPDIITATVAYRFLSMVGQGGMGVIYRGFDLNLERDVAIKVLRREYADNPRIVERFLSESLIKSSMQHPGVAPVYARGVCADGRPYYAMKLIEGQTLSRLLSERGKPLKLRLLSIFAHVCHTMAYAHSKGIVHLDLKPSNIMIGDYDRVRVIDWGLARRIGSPELEASEHEFRMEYALRSEASDTQSGCIRGTPAYMAPEQARGELLDARTDVFALGAILCEILTGNPIYSDDHPQGVLGHALRGATSHAIGELAKRETAQWLIGLVTRCLAAHPNDRPLHAGEVAREFVDFQESVSNLAHKDMVRFFELSPDLFCIAGFDGCFRRINANFPRVTGYTEHELLSQPFLNFVHADDKERTIVEMSRNVQGLPVERFRNRYLHRDGSVLHLEWTSQSVVAEGLIYAVARDVTPKRGELANTL